MADIQSLIKKGKPAAPSKFIVMGDPFTGKTTLAAKAPKPLFLSFDGNAAKAGLDAIDGVSMDIVREAVQNFFPKSDYQTLVIDTVEGVADLFERSVIDQYQQETGTRIQSLNDVPYGKLTGQYNRKMAAFAETLLGLPKNVIVLSYTKRQIDDVTNSVVLASELKNINKFTKFADGMILTTYDGEKYQARMISKRTVMAGEVDYGGIIDFLKAAGWEMPQRKTKLSSTKR